jgi:transposase
MKKVFIGIDFSKLKFDAVVLKAHPSESYHHKEFTNDHPGFGQLVLWVSTLTANDPSSWLFCGEHTGLYSLLLTKHLNSLSLDIWLENPLQIKRSMGIKRGKNDKIDALQIALYAYRFRDKFRSACLDGDTIDQIRDLLAHRERLIKTKKILQTPVKEMLKVKTTDSLLLIAGQSESYALQIEKDLKCINKQIKTLLKADSRLFQNANLLTSIKGIGFQNALMVLVLTGNFTRFNDPRKFGCYAGVVPFPHSSGTSIYKKEKVSKLANKKMKTLLSNAANAAVRHDKNLKDYFIRKLQDGKERSLVINNVRNKLIHIMFAVVKNKQNYDPDYKLNYKQLA